VSASATTDEIFDRYLKKAITEINRLSDEISQAAASRVPVLPSGHPLASIFLLKHSPKPQEVQEGIAFLGRAGNALI
jgi:uracil-DNA glycosylase